jgi:hypothetical protein
MRFRQWLMLSGLVAVLALTALPAAAQNTGFDQVKIISDLTRQLPEPVNPTREWLDIGTSLPVGTFDDRGWDPGLLLRWNQEVWTDGAASIVGSLGLAFNDMSRFNEEQIDNAFDAGFDGMDTVSVYSSHHVGIPFAVELQLEPSRQGEWSPFVAVGPAVQYTNESAVRQRYYPVVYEDYVPFVCPVSTYTPPSPALVADRKLNKTHFHLGFQLRGGLRFNAGNVDNPLRMRLTATWNAWYEHSHPISMVGAALSFGR